MASSDETQPNDSTAAGADKADEPAWPPAEARPEDSATAAQNGQAKAEPEPKPAASTEAAPAEAAILTKPAEAEAGPWEEKASEPKQEMGLSESTLHWLVDGEQVIEPRETDPATGPVYDSRAPVAGRKRNVAVIGGAAIVAFVVALVLHGQAASHRTAVEAPAAEPASVLTGRAEGALAAGRSGEAMELAHLAIVADPRFANAYVVVGKVQRDSGRPAEARDAYRKYLELAPLGTHAQEARDALTALPP